MMDMLTIKKIGRGYVVIYPGPDGKGEFVRVLASSQALMQQVAAWARSQESAAAHAPNR